MTQLSHPRLRSPQSPFDARTRRSLQRVARSTPLVLAMVVASAAQRAAAQVVTFTSRNGQNTAFCGPVGSGLLVHHQFSTPVASNDPVSLSDAGGPNWSPSNASTQFVATLAPSGLSLVGSGSATRGPLIGLGISATADTRDEWDFTVSAPIHVTFSASLSATSTAPASMPVQTYTLGGLGGGAQIIPDPGTPPGAFANAILAPGSVAASGSGTFMPGLYFVSLNGSMDGGNTWPYSGSFNNSISIAFDCGVMTSYCTSGTTTHGCAATIQGTGSPSASATSGFTLSVTGMEGASQGLILYGVSGRSAVPWGTSSSFLCVKSPTQRTSAQNGGGTAGACDGAMNLDWNAFVANHPGALGAPFSSGQLVQAQGWFRDPPSPKSTMLSDAVEFALCP